MISGSKKMPFRIPPILPEAVKRQGLSVPKRSTISRIGASEVLPEPHPPRANL